MRVLAVVFLCVGTIFAAEAGAPMKFLSIGKISTVALVPGTPTEVIIPVVVEKELHVQSNPASNPRLIATILEVSESDGIKPGTPVYPAGKPYRLQGAASEISVYGGKFEIKLPLFALASASAGKHQIQGKLKFQACNDKICFFPSNVPVVIPIHVKK